MPPLRGHGLKYHGQDGHALAKQDAPIAGAWVEISRDVKHFVDPVQDAPIAGAWVEMMA